ncbi:MAG: hypothetical protein L6V91_00440 [Bacilli bacterium]|nr:MAG: hypothetical protein L6V91_00440 [Bacilli bacterium]
MEGKDNLVKTMQEKINNILKLKRRAIARRKIPSCRNGNTHRYWQSQ